MPENEPPCRLVPKTGEPPSAPASATMPVARKVSGTMQADPEARMRALVLKLVESALDAYRDARVARAAGDDASADLLCAAADRAVATANETIEELATA